MISSLAMTENQTFLAMRDAERVFQNALREKNEMKAKMDRAWEIRKEAETEMNNEFERFVEAKENSQAEASRLTEEIRELAEAANVAHEEMIKLAKVSEVTTSGKMKKMRAKQAVAAQKRRDELNQKVKAKKRQRRRIAASSDEFYAAKARYLKAKQEHEDLRQRYIKARELVDALEAEKNLRISQHIVAQSELKKAKEFEQKAEETRLLKQAKIPKKYWEGCVIKISDDGTVDFIYDTDPNDREEHSHVIMRNGHVFYRRLRGMSRGAGNYVTSTCGVGFWQKLFHRKG